MKYITSLVLLLVMSWNLFGQSISFTEERGYYDTPFSLELSSDISNSTIKYVINGNPLSTAITYNNPISITTTTTIRAFAFSNTDTSAVESQTYIFVDDVIQQPDVTPGFPTGTGISNTIQNDPVYGPLLDDALTSIPVVCISLEQTDYSFIYSNKGILKAGNVEFFDDSNGDSYGKPTGVMVYGNSSFAAGSANKKNYRFKFRDEYGAKKFKFPIFGKDAADEFDSFDLRAGGQETLDRGGVHNMHEKILKDWQTQMSGFGVHGRFVHVYINAVYWGVYTMSERPEKSFGESYYSGNKDDYNTIKTTCCSSTPAAIDGTVSSFNYMVSQAGNYPAIEQYLDVDHFIDWVTLCNYGPHGDWTPWNTYAIDNPTANEPFRFFMWDPEPSFYSDWYYTNKTANTTYWENLWQPLKANIDFRMRVADHFECNCIEPDGPLNPINAEDYYTEVFDAHSLAYLAECARWADNLYDDFLQYRQDLVTSGWFYNRMNIVKTDYKNNDLYPNIDAVQFNVPSGAANVGTQITLSNPNASGTIYYTTDGTDPRAPGGNIAGSAQVYSGSITLAQGVIEFKARVKSGTTWSAMCPKRFYVDMDYSGLVINEIMYHASDTCSSNDSEMDYIELYNSGTIAVNLADSKFDIGIKYKFPITASIAPGGYYILAENADIFSLNYGFMPDAQYRGGLSNDGESIVFVDFNGNAIDSVWYNDVNPWDEDPDGEGPSLELLNPALDNTNPINWFRSDDICGTPGAPNSRVCNGTADAIVINEINYNSNNYISDPGDWVELHNPNSAPVNISGWTFYDNNNEFTFPSGTILNAGAFLVLVEDNTMFTSVFSNVPVTNKLGNFVFGLSNKGERISLFDENKCLSDYVIYNDRIPWDTIPDGNGPTLSLITPNSDNTLPGSWESSSNINAPLGTPGRANSPCPSFSIAAPNLICKDDTVLFHTTTNNAVNFTWTIQGGTPTTATGDSVFVVFQNPGLAIVELQFTYFECTDNVQQLITVQTCNNPPVPQPDNYSVDEDNALTDNVLTNDADPENQPMTVSLINDVTNGNLTLNSNGSFTFNPTSNYFGSDNFTYEVCDNASPALCATQLVNISINAVNDAPISSSDFFQADEDNTIADNILTNDSDIDGNALTTSIQTMPANGTLTLQTNGDFTYSPTANYFGSDVFSYEVCDDGLPSLCVIETVNLSIIPVNDPPITVAENYTLNEDDSISNNVLTNDSDIENQPLTSQVIVNCSNGTLSFDPDGSFMYVPNANYFGSDNFIYEVCDNANPPLCASQLVNIIVNPVNDSPVSTSDSYQGNEDNTIIGNVLTNDSDIDGNTLSAIITTMPANGALTLQTDGSFTYNPNANYFGIDVFNYEVCDDGSPSLCVTETVNLSIVSVDDPPATTADNYTTNEDNSLSDNVLTNDVEIENQPLASSLLVNCSNGSLFFNSSGGFTYIPFSNFFGLDSFVYEVCDNSSPALCTQETATINVLPINDEPILLNDTLTTDEGIQVAGNASTNDYDVETAQLSYILTTFTQNGSVLFNFDGSFYYAPFAGFSGIDSFQYRACDNGTPNYCDTATVFIDVIPDCVTLDIDLALEGAYNPQTGYMKTTLNTVRAILPGMTGNPIAGQPYNSPPWNYPGTEGAGWTDTDYANTVVDWVLISFRTDITKGSEVYRRAGLLHTDGSVTFPGECLTTSELSGNYYLVVEHRNHMAVMSPIKLSVVNRILSWDFRLANSYESGGNGAKQLSSGIWALFSGDNNQVDDIVQSDINGKDKASWLLDNGKFGVYLTSDINMNGDVNGSDKALWLINNGVFGSVKK